VAALTEDGGGSGILISTPAMGGTVQSPMWTKGLREEKSALVQARDEE
jgi:hypothetical protein